MTPRLSTRDGVSLMARGNVVFDYMEAGLYYPWFFGYNSELKEADLQKALMEYKKHATEQEPCGN